MIAQLSIIGIMLQSSVVWIFRGALKEPAFVQLRNDRPAALSLAVSITAGADQMMQQAIFLGAYSGHSAAIISNEIMIVKNSVGRSA